MSAAPPGSSEAPAASAVLGSALGSALGPALVTGATGFLGGHLVRRLRAEGVPVRPLSRRAGEDGVRVDLAREALPAGACDGIATVFHLAALTHAEAAAAPEAAYQALNVEGTRRVLDAALTAGVRRFVLASSVKAIGEGGAMRVDEDSEPRPVTAYGRSKLAAERLVLAAGDRVHVACLRLPLVYGVGQQGNLRRMIDAIDRGRFPPPPRRRNRRSMVHVEDVVSALLLLAADPRARGRIYLLADPEPYATRDLYDWIREAAGKRPQPLAVPYSVLWALARAGDLAGRLLRRRVPFDGEALEKLLGSAWYGSDRIAGELGFCPRHDLRGELPALVADARARRDGSPS